MTILPSHSYRALFTLSLVFCYFSPSASQSESNFHRIDKVKFIADPKNEFSLEDILVMKDTVPSTSWNYVASQENIWIIVKPDKFLKETNAFIFSMKGGAKNVLIHYQSGTRWETKVWNPSSLSSLDQGRLLYPFLDLNKIDQNTELVLQLAGPVVPAMLFEKKNGVYSRLNSKLFATSIFIGCLFFILVINLFRWINSREYIFGIYALYMLLFISHMLAFGGNNILFTLIPIDPYPKFLLHLSTVFMTNAIASWYGITFLKLKAQLPIIYYLLLGFVAMTFVVLGLVIVNPGIGPFLANSSLCILLTLLCYAGMVKWKRGEKYVFWYVLAYLTFALLLIIFTYQRNVDYAFPFIYPVPLFYYGILAESFLLNISLNLKVDFEKEQAILEKEKAQEKHIELQLKQNLVLEDRVAERTKELENALKTIKQTQTQLVESEKMASLGILSAGIGHEINNPLNFIKGGIDGLLIQYKQKNLKGDDNTERYLDAVSEGVSRASSIVNSLSHLSRAGSKMNESCDLKQILDNCLIILQNELKHRIEIKKDYSEEPHIIQGNDGRLHQAFLNILINAAQAIEDVGTIEISTKQIKHQKIVTIRDTGKGIERKDMDKIMDPFFTTKNPGEGTGLGLSITYKIIKEHHGRIQIDSAPEKGTTFKIIFNKK